MRRTLARAAAQALVHSGLRHLQIGAGVPLREHPS
jgi:hypothetical protein